MNNQRKKLITIIKKGNDNIFIKKIVFLSSYVINSDDFFLYFLIHCKIVCKYYLSISPLDQIAPIQQ